MALGTFGAMRYYLLCCLLTLVGRLSGQVTWQFSYGGFSTEEGNSVITTNDGRYLVVGSTGSFGAGGGDVYFLMLDADGHRQWSGTLGGAGVDQGSQVRQTPDGGFIICGFTNSYGAGGYDGYVAKISMQGVVIWSRTFGGPEWDFFHSVTVCQDGGYLLAGETYSSGNGASDAWFVRISDAGDELWSRTVGGSGIDLARCVISTSDGGYCFAGARTSGGNEDAWLGKLAANGDTVWTSANGGDSLDYAVSLIETSDGGFAAVGTTESFSQFTEAYHFKVDASGQELLWQHHWGAIHDQETKEQKVRSDGSYVSVGYVASGGSGGLDMFILFTDPNGDFLAGVTNGGDNGENDEFGASLDLASDGGFILCGYTKSFGFGPKDVYVVKTDSAGLTEFNSVIEEFDPVALPESLPQGVLPLFPNPATNTTRMISMHGTRSIGILDSQGRLVREWQQPVPQDLDLHGLSDGMYQLVTVSDKGVRTAQPLIISNH